VAGDEPRVNDGKRPMETESRRVTKAVQWTLGVGLAVSALLMLAGLAGSLAAGRRLPKVVLEPGPALRQALHLHAAGLLSLGLLVLILTPFLRVAGTLVVFLREHDWRYTAVTAVVLTVMIVSLFVGQA